MVMMSNCVRREHGERKVDSLGLASENVLYSLFKIRFTEQ